MFDRTERKHYNAARETLPAGFYIVRDGSTRPDDLLFSWTTKEWLRADSNQWTAATPADVADCFAVARRPGLKMPGAAVRRYSITRNIAVTSDSLPGPNFSNERPKEATPKTALQDPEPAQMSQPALF